MVGNADKADLLIIGGGVLGAFHAYHARQRGLTVTLIERNAAPRSATVRNFGQVVPSGLDSTWQQYGRESLEIYKSLQSEFDLSVRNLGSIYIASDSDELQLLEELRDIDASNGYASELKTAEWCLQRYPELRSDYCKAGLFYPEEVSVNPRVMVHQLHQLLASQGVQAQFGQCVCRLESQSAEVAATTTCGQTYVADRAIVCNGAEFQALFPDRFAKSDLRAVKLQMMRLKPQSNVSIPGNVLTGLSIRRYESFAQCPSWTDVKSREEEDSFWKKWGVHILFKQEADGGIILGDSHEYASAANIDDLSFDLHQDVSEYFIAEAQKIFDLPSWDVEAEWYGVYCQTDHPSGIYTQTIDENIHLVTGIGGKGMTSSAGYSRHHLKEIYND